MEIECRYTLRTETHVIAITRTKRKDLICNTNLVQIYQINDAEKTELVFEGRLKFDVLSSVAMLIKDSIEM